MKHKLPVANTLTAITEHKYARKECVQITASICGETLYVKVIIQLDAMKLKLDMDVAKCAKTASKKFVLPKEELPVNFRLNGTTQPISRVQMMGIVVGHGVTKWMVVWAIALLEKKNHVIRAMILIAQNQKKSFVDHAENICECLQDASCKNLKIYTKILCTFCTHSHLRQDTMKYLRCWLMSRFC